MRELVTENSQKTNRTCSSEARTILTYVNHDAIVHDAYLLRAFFVHGASNRDRVIVSDHCADDPCTRNSLARSVLLLFLSSFRYCYGTNTSTNTGARAHRMTRSLTRSLTPIVALR